MVVASIPLLLLSHERLVPSRLLVMNHPGHHPYPSSSQNLHHPHRPPHNQVIVGHNQRLDGDPRRIEHVDGGYILCSAGMFTGRIIRAEAEEVRKCREEVRLLPRTMRVLDFG